MWWPVPSRPPSTACKRVLRVGDAFVAAHGATHGVVALEAGSTLLDQFSPRREDYL